MSWLGECPTGRCVIKINVPMTWVSFCIYHCYDLLEYDNNNYGFFLYFDVAENIANVTQWY